MIHKVARMGHPVLREKAKLISPKEIKSAEIQQLIQDLVDTMEEYGGIGIAAPQIHIARSIAIIRMETDSEKYKSDVQLGAKAGKYKDANGDPVAVFINPVIKILDEKRQEFWEGCLSVPGLRGLVSRPRKVSVEYFDENGEKQKITVDEFSATVVQHELDHLQGTLYVDRIQDKTKLMFEEEYIKYHQSQEVKEID